MKVKAEAEEEKMNFELSYSFVAVWAVGEEAALNYSEFLISFLINFVENFVNYLAWIREILPNDLN